MNTSTLSLASRALWAAGSLLLCGASLTAQITPGNLVVVRIGDGSAALTNAATPTYLDEYTTAGVLVQTIAMPTVASLPNFALVNSGTATSEGFLNVSDNGLFLVLAGYDAQVGTPAVATTASATNARVVGRVDLGGVVDTSTALNDCYSAGNIRSATSENGLWFWTAGTAATNASVRFAFAGATTSTAIGSSPSNTRVVSIANRQLFVSSATGSYQGVSQVGTGLPNSSGQSINLLPGFPTATGPSAYDYFFADPVTLYVADDRVNGSGGIQKWTWAAGVWTLQYTLAPATNLGCRGLTGIDNGGLITLYATTTQASANTIVSVADVGAGSPFTTVATASANTVLRGLRLVNGCPRASTEVFGHGSPNAAGTPTIACNTAFHDGTAPAVTVSGFLPSNFAFYLIGLRSAPLDLTFLGGQPGSELYLSLLASVTVATDAGGGASLALGIPPVSTLCGAALTWQVIQVDPSLAFSLPLTTSPGLEGRIGM